MSEVSSDPFFTRVGGRGKGDGRNDGEPGDDPMLWRESRNDRSRGEGIARGVEDDAGVVDREPSRVCVQTLGEFRLFLSLGQDRWVEAPDRGRWGHGRALELLLLLLLQRRAVTRGEAAAALWPKSDGARRAKLLRNALWNLRKALESLNMLALGQAERGRLDGAHVAQLVFRETPQTLRLVSVAPTTQERDPVGMTGTMVENLSTQRLTAMIRTGYGVSSGMSSGIWCDALAFENACQRAGAATAPEERLRWSQTGLALYTGVFLPGIERADWIESQRTRLEERWARLCVDAAGALRRLRETERALGLLLNVVERQPQHAEAAHHAMTLLAGAGKVAEALRVYERTRRAFRQEYGSEPESLRRLVNEIRAGRFLHDGADRTGRSPRASGDRWRIEPADVEGW